MLSVLLVALELPSFMGERRREGVIRRPTDARDNDGSDGRAPDGAAGAELSPRSAPRGGARIRRAHGRRFLVAVRAAPGGSGAARSRDARTGAAVTRAPQGGIEP